MRAILVTVIALVAAAPTSAVDLQNLDDAPLHAVQFVDRDQGWAVGDEGLIWHTTDGGRHWVMQPTGVRASLRSLHFRNAATGWVAGRQEMPGSGSLGVLLVTRNGGLTWRHVAANQFPGFNHICFADDLHGYVVGDSTEQYPTGIFTTTDGGRNWMPIRGPRYPTWLAADFGAGGGALAGAWNRLATLTGGQLRDADVDTFGGRNVNALRLQGNRAVAVTDGGLVLLSDNAGTRWRIADLHLPTSLRDDWDFRGVSYLGQHIWVAGRPGSALLHSGDAGKSWQIVPTHQPVPLGAIHFVDELHGWAVGELGTILATVDGGKTWQVQRRGGQRAAILFVHTSPASVPVDTVAQLGGQDGYLAVAVAVSRPDPESAPLNEAAADFRLAAASRAAGGAAGETLWQFPLAEHQFRAGPESVLQSWDRLHEDRGGEALVRQLVLTLRTWRPDVIVVDSPEEDAGLPVERLIAHSVRTAYAKAADPVAFQDQLKTLGVEPWQASKLYALATDVTMGQAVLDTDEACPRLEATAREFAAGPAELLGQAPATLPVQRHYWLYESRLANAGKGLLDGLRMTPAGICRRSLELVTPQPGLLKSIQARRSLETLASLPAGPLASPDALIGQVLPTLNQMPPDRAADALFALADLDARLGRWRLAHELFATFINRYPTAPHAVDAYRWLIQFAGSSEARRREELGERVGQATLEIKSTNSQHLISSGGLRPTGAIVKGGAEMIGNGAVGIVTDATARRKYYQECVALGDRLAGCGSMFAEDPATQFCLQAARRQVGDFDTPHRWYQHFVNEHPAGPWHDAAAAELWLSARYGQPPKLAAFCRRLSERPYLDGELDEACWQNAKPLVLQNAAGTTAKAYPTEAWLTYDKDFLYLAVRCRRPAGQVVPLVKVRPRDADLRPYDRVSLMLDLDRDYSSFFHLQIDERGCVCDEFCQGEYHDLTWDPRWFVAVHSTATGWQAEAAIPMNELTALPVTMGHAWACNVVRVIPGRGVQAWSTPAGVKPRPEGMGLLMFIGEDTKIRPDSEATGR